MEITRSNLHMSRTKGKNGVTITIDEDISLPEGKGGIDNKIKDMGEVCIEKIRPMEERVNIGGYLYFGMLYQSENGCRSYYGKVPFDETIMQPEVNSQDLIRGKATLMDMKISIINSYKISIRAAIHIILCNEVIVETDIVSQLDVENLQCRRLDMKLQRMICGKKDNFRIRESVGIDKDMKNIGDIVWHQMNIDKIEYTGGEGNVGIKGIMDIFIIYTGENSEETITYCGKIPFSGYISVPDGRINDIYDICINAVEKNVIIRNDSNGEARIFDCEAIVSLDIRSYRSENTEIISDMYAPMYKVGMQKQNFTVENFVDKRIIKHEISERFGCQIPGKIMYTDAEVTIEDTTIKNNRLELEGVVGVDIFLEGTDIIKNMHYDLPFTRIVEMENATPESIAVINVQEKDFAAKRSAPNEVGISGSFELCIYLKNIMQQAFITEVSVEEYSAEEIKQRPVLTGYVVKRGDTLFEIAKKYCTRVDDIAQINNLERGGDEIKEGTKLLIACVRNQ